MQLVKREVTDNNQIIDFIRDNELEDDVTPDNINLNEVDFIGSDLRLLGYFLNNEPIAIVGYNAFRDGVKVHPMISKAARLKSREIIKDSLSGINNAYIEIVNDKKKLNMCKKLGFEKIGEGKAFSKGGVTSKNLIMRLCK